MLDFIKVYIRKKSSYINKSIDRTIIYTIKIEKKLELEKEKEIPTLRFFFYNYRLLVLNAPQNILHFLK